MAAATSGKDETAQVQYTYACVFSVLLVVERWM